MYVKLAATAPFTIGKEDKRERERPCFLITGCAVLPPMQTSNSKNGVSMRQKNVYM
jgi:hypothetical protein